VLTRRLRRGRGLPAGGFEIEHGKLELPVAVISGWLLAERGYGRVEVRVGDLPPSPARLFSRPTLLLAAAGAEPSAVMAGWSATVDLEGLPSGTRVTVRATAHGPGRELELGAVEAELVERPPRPSSDPVWVAELAGRVERLAAGHAPAEPLNALAFAHGLGRSGGELVLTELVTHLASETGLECTVIVPGDGPLRPELEDAGAEVHISHRPDQGDRYEARMLDLALLARERGAGCVIANTILSFDGVDLAQRLGLPSVWAIHESMSLNELLFASWLEADDHVAGRVSEALRNADLILFEADATRRIFAAEVPDPDRLRTLPYGIEIDQGDHDPPDRERFRRDHGLEPTDRVLLCPGIPQPRKAHAQLALAFARLAPERPDLRLCMVGNDRVVPDYVGGLRELIRRLDLPPGRIRLEPETSRMSDWYAAADYMVLGSDNESLPRVILEGMSHRLPVLATSVHGVPEVIDHGRNGLLCAPADLDALTEGLRELVALSPQRAAAIGREAAVTARGWRDRSAYAAEVRDAIDRLVEGGRPSPASTSPAS
jgi:glycosyltransferase involved in cell wall biosynthesis